MGRITEPRTWQAHRAGWLERGGQNHVVAHGDGPAQARTGLDRFRRSRCDPPVTPRQSSPGDGAGAGRAPVVPTHECLRKPGDGRLYQAGESELSGEPGESIRYAPPPEGAGGSEGRHTFWRGAADAGCRPRAYGRAGDPHVRRAVSGTGPAAGVKPV